MQGSRRPLVNLLAAAAVAVGLVAVTQPFQSASVAPTIDHYVVLAGETFTAIGNKLGLDVNALADANGTTQSAGRPNVNTALRTGRIIHLCNCPVTPPTTTTTPTTLAPTTSTTSPASTAAPTTTTIAPTTTSTIAATTTTAPSAGTFFEGFSAPLDPAKFTTAWWRDEEAGQLDPLLNGSLVRIENGQLRIETGEQNYGDGAVRINQPFDFAGRTGTIAFDVTLDAKDGWTRFTLSQDPYAVTSYGDDNAAGQGADRGIDLQFALFAGCANVELRTYANRVETDLPGPQFPSPCVLGSPIALTHVVVTISNSSVMVMSGATMLGSWTGLNLGFSRGYIYLDSHNHATIKYASQPTWINHWDNVTFDGPTLPALNVSAAATIEGRTLTNVAASPVNPRLIFNAQHGQQDANPTLTYRLNGNAAHAVPLQRLAGLIGVYMLSLPVDPAELVAGTNTVAFTWTGTTGLAPRVADVQVTWEGSGPSPPPTTTTTPAPTTTAPATTTSTSTSPTTTQPATTTTTAPTAGVQFVEDFSSPTAFAQRFDHGWSGEVAAGLLFGDNANNWPGDHDMNCADPNMTHRTITVSPGPGEPGVPSGSVRNVEQAFYPCLPGGDPAKGHLMTSINTEGYVTAWFSPKQVFTNVVRVCWDQNLTDLKGGKWTLVNFLLPSEYSGETDLGYTSPDFAPATGLPSSPQGDAGNGVKLFLGGMQVYNNHLMGASVGGALTTDKAARFTHCITDNGNGTLTLTRSQPGGATLTSTVAGFIPDGQIRVVFVDDSYNPDKHQEPSVARNTSVGYTWHWDSILVAGAAAA